MTDLKLTDKQQTFIYEYLKCWNATEAARRAGYKGTDVTLASMGYENLRKPQIAEAIQAEMAANAMSAHEALSRLSDMARGSMAEFLDEKRETLDLAKADRADKLHLIKSFSHTKSKETENIKIELYDAQAAIFAIIKELRLDAGKATERKELTGKDGGAIESRVTVFSELSDEQLDSYINGNPPSEGRESPSSDLS